MSPGCPVTVSGNLYCSLPEVQQVNKSQFTDWPRYLHWCWIYLLGLVFPYFLMMPCQSWMTTGLYTKSWHYHVLLAFGSTNRIRFFSLFNSLMSIYSKIWINQWNLKCIIKIMVCCVIASLGNERIECLRVDMCVLSIRYTTHCWASLAPCKCTPSYPLWCWLTSCPQLCSRCRRACTLSLQVQGHSCVFGSKGWAFCSICRLKPWSER